MIQSIVAILGGLIAATPFITSKRPTASGFLHSISEYRGYIGIALLIWGIIGFFRLLSHGLFSSGAIGLCVTAAEFVVGFLLAYDLVQEHLLKNNAKASEVGSDMKKGLSQFEVPAGIVLIVCGVLSIIF